MKRIVYLAYDEKRGLTYHFTDIIIKLFENADEKVDISVITIKKESNKDLFFKLSKFNDKIKIINSSKELKKFDFNNIDIVHTNSFRPLYYLIKLKKKYNYKILITLHAFFNGTNFQYIFSNLFTLFFIPFIDHIHFLSYKSLSEFLKFNVFSCLINFNYSIFGLGYNEKEFEAIKKLPDYISDKIRRKNNLNLVYIANFTKNKNHKNLIRAIKKILISNNCRLILLGEGKELIKIKKLVEKNSLSQKVVFLGRVDREYIPSILSECDIGLFFSKSENSPHGILECIASGLPVIASEVGNSSELIKDYYNGFLVRKNDLNNFSTKVEILFNDPTLRRQLGINAKLFANSFFTWEKFVDKTLKLYKYL